MLLSILIPTYNRYKYLKKVIDALLLLKYDDYEIVIQDNSEDNEAFLEYLKEKNNDKIKYFHSRKKLSVSENFDKAVKNSCGEFLIAIGDDDCICNSIFPMVEHMKKHKIDACSYPSTFYYWQDLTQDASTNIPSLVLPHINGKLKKILPKKELNKILSTCLFSLDKLPKLYHGILSRDLCNRIVDKFGTCFPGESPDIANATAAVLCAKKCVYVYAPLSIAGNCVQSGGGMGMKKTHVREIKDVPWLSKNALNNWDKRVPAFWTAETVWSTSITSVLNSSNVSDKDRIGLVKFNYGRLYGNFFYYHPDIKNKLKSICGAYNKALLYQPVIIFSGIIRKLKRCIKKSSKKFYNISDISAAVDFVDDIYKLDLKIDGGILDE